MKETTMKFELTFKTPNVTDAIHYQLPSGNCLMHSDQFNHDCDDCYNLYFHANDELEASRELAAKFVEYDEYIKVEFDTVTGTATVIPTKKAR